MQADQQGAATDGEPQLRQNDTTKHSPRPEAKCCCGILQSRIETPQRRRHRQIEKWKIGDDGNKDASPQSVQSRHHSDPGVAVHEGGDGERRH
jgi:hypothetical protein